MNRILVWDLPTRVFHWVFAGSLTAALVLGFGLDDEHPLFAYHMLFGLVAGFAVATRLVWGFAGSRPARFSSWTWSPRELARYLGGMFSGSSTRYVSHNPATSWVSAALFGLVALLIATGIGAPETMEEVHEVLAFGLIAAITAHLAGLAWHTIRHRENIAWSMVDGRKAGPPEAALGSGRGVAGVLLVVLIGAWAGALWRNYDAATGRVRLPATSLEIQLGEPHDESNVREEHRDRHADD